MGIFGFRVVCGVRRVLVFLKVEVGFVDGLTVV